VLDLEPTSAETYEAAVRGDQPERAVFPAPQHDPPVSPEHSIVVIDPGHGGIDSGATGADGLREKDITLEFGLALARALEEGGKLQPVLTRDGDAFLSLSDRVQLAQQQKAALFISIHADSVRQDYVRGATVYTLSDDASDELAAALADRENRSDILAGMALEDEADEVADILFDLALQETRTISVRFASALVEDMDGVMPLNSNPWRRAAFRVLKAPDVPSVLLELGYLSNAEDEKLFHSEEWPENEARAVAEAIEEFFEGRMAAGQ
jgi:N-acetylmuramoyl-L-alanine amidase